MRALIHAGRKVPGWRGRTRSVSVANIMGALVRRGAAVLAAVFMASAAADAHAATITVAAGDTLGLIAAINTANATPAADTVQISGTYTFTTADNSWYGPNALPAITTDVTVTGTATGTLIRASNASRLRLFYVSGGRSGLTAGTLRLRGVELANGVARGGGSGFGGAGAGLGGAIYNQGTLDLAGVTLVNNQALGGNATPMAQNINAGGGLGQDGTSTRGGGFGGAAPGVNGGSGGAGGAAPLGGGGGGGGYGAADDGRAGGAPAGGAGRGTAHGLGGHNQHAIRGGNGAGAGGQAGANTKAIGGAGGDFGNGGLNGT